MAVDKPCDGVAPCFKINGVSLRRIYEARYFGYTPSFARHGKLMVEHGPQLRAFFGSANAVAPILGGPVPELCASGYSLPMSYCSPADMLYMIAEHLSPQGLAKKSLA